MNLEPLQISHLPTRQRAALASRSASASASCRARSAFSAALGGLPLLPFSTRGAFGLLRFARSAFFVRSLRRFLRASFFVGLARRCDLR